LSASLANSLEGLYGLALFIAQPSAFARGRGLPVDYPALGLARFLRTLQHAELMRPGIDTANRLTETMFTRGVLWVSPIRVHFGIACVNAPAHVNQQLSHVLEQARELVSFQQIFELAIRRAVLLECVGKLPAATGRVRGVQIPERVQTESAKMFVGLAPRCHR